MQTDTTEQQKDIKNLSWPLAMAQYMELKEKWMIFSLQEYYLVGQEFLRPITVGADRDWCLTSSFCYYHFLPHKSWPHNFPLSSNPRTEPDRQSKSTSRVQLTFSGNLSQFLKVLSKPTVWEKEQSIGNITMWSSSPRFSNNDLSYKSFTSSVQQTTYNTRISKSTEH